MSQSPETASAEGSFDPWHKWLGIPASEQPPNYYRMLGIATFESDPEVIEAAANRQMSYVKQCASGPHRRESHEVLNVLSEARLCLLSPREKSSYDAQLRGPAPSSSAPDESERDVGPSFEASVGKTASASAKRGGRGKPARKRRDESMLGTLVAVILGGVTAVALAKYIGDVNSRRPAVGAVPQVDAEQSTPTSNLVRKTNRAVASDSASRSPRKSESRSPPISEVERIIPRQLPRFDRPVSSASPVPVPTLQKDQVDLIATLDRASASLVGDWSVLGSTLIAPNSPDAACQFDNKPGDNYVAEFVVERRSGMDYLAVGLVSGNHQLLVKIDAAGGTCSGIEGIEGYPFNQNRSTRRGAFLPAGRQHIIVCRVTPEELRVEVNDQPIVELKNGYRERLTELEYPWSDARRGALFLGSNRSLFHISRAVVTRVSSAAGAPEVRQATVESVMPNVLGKAFSAVVVPRAPVPEVGSLSELERDINQQFKKEVQGRKLSKQLLAKQLFAKAEQSGMDPARRFVLLAMARKAAEKAGEVTLAWKAVNHTIEKFEVVPLPLKVETLTELSKSLTTATASREFAELLPVVILETLDAGDLDTALKLSSLGVDASRKAGSAALEMRMEELHEEVQSRKRESTTAKEQ